MRPSLVILAMLLMACLATPAMAEGDIPSFLGNFLDEASGIVTNTNAAGAVKVYGNLEVTEAPVLLSPVSEDLQAELTVGGKKAKLELDWVYDSRMVDPTLQLQSEVDLYLGLGITGKAGNGFLTAGAAWVAPHVSSYGVAVFAGAGVSWAW